LTTLDVLLPTYRWNSYVRGYIRYLDSIVSDSEVSLRLHIGDNSCNSDKHSFLRGLNNPNIQVHLNETNVGAYANFQNLFFRSDGDFVLSIGDDDWIHPDVFAHAAFLAENSQCSACVGVLAAFPPRMNAAGACFDDRFMGADAVKRALDYIRYSLWEHDVNWLALATHRRSTLTIYLEYAKRHPFNLYFRDQMLSQIALLTGPVKGLRHGISVYKNRPADELRGHLENIAGSVDDMGLPPWLYIFYYHYWLGCEYASLYLYRGIPDGQFADRLSDADKVFIELFTRFRMTYDKNPAKYEAHFKEAGISDAMHDVLDDPTAVVALRSLATIFRAHNPEAGKRYADFLRKEMVVDIGE